MSDDRQDVVDEWRVNARRCRGRRLRGDRGASDQEAAVGQGGVRPVEEPELALFEGSDVLDQLRTDLRDIWRRGLVGLHDPRTVALGGHRAEVDQAEPSCHVGDVLVGRRRHHPVDHGVGERTCSAIHSGRTGPSAGGDLGDPRPEQVAVAGHVVQRCHHRRRPAGLRASRASESARTPGADAGAVRSLEVVGFGVVALLGDRQGHQPLSGARDQRCERRRCTRGDRGEGADDPQPRFGPGLPLGHGVEAVLRSELFLRGGLWSETPRISAGWPAAEQVVCVDGEVRPGEGADPEVGDGRRAGRS